MKTLKEIRAEKLYLYFAEQMCNLINDCKNTIELITNGQIGGCYKRIIKEQDIKIKTIRFCLSICDGLYSKYLERVDEEWLDARRSELADIMNFYC